MNVADGPSGSSPPSNSLKGGIRNIPHRWIFLALLFVAAGIGFLFLPVSSWIAAMQRHVDTLGWAGPVAFIFLYALMTVLLVPGTAMTIAAGVFFGLFGGALCAIAASNLGALAAFLLARTVMRGRVETWARANPKFGAVDAALAKSGFKVVVLLRLSPVFPFGLLNYMLGLTRVSVLHYVLGGVIGMLPATVLFTYIGSLSASLAGQAAGDTANVRHMKLALKIVGFLATVLATWLITRTANKALKAASPASDASPKSSDADRRPGS